jgi:hypothetical protein
MMRVALVGIALALVGSASAVTITFEELGLQTGFFVNANPLRNEYNALGVNFFGPGISDGGAILNQSGNFGVNAHSGEHFLAFNRSTNGTTMLNGGRPIDPEQINFSTTATTVSIWASGGSETGTFAITGFNSSGGYLGTTIINTAVGQWGLLTFTNANIDHVTLSELSNAGSFVYDDLNFSTVPEPASIAALGLGALALIRRRKANKA